VDDEDLSEDIRNNKGRGQARKGLVPCSCCGAMMSDKRLSSIFNFQCEDCHEDRKESTGDDTEGASKG